MAKKCWNTENVEKGILIRQYDGDVKDLTINIAELFVDLFDRDEAEFGCIVNGVKQKLADTIARSKDEKLTEQEKRDAQEALWTRMSVERKWNMPKQGGGVRGPAVSYKVIVPALEGSGLDITAIAATLSTTEERVAPFMSDYVKPEKEAKPE